MSARFSIITPCFNRADVVTETLDSVLREKNNSNLIIEQIVIDDGSSDNTASVVQRWVEEHDASDWVTLYILPENCGLATAKNAGIDRATGDLIVFLDSDDQLMPNSLHWINQHFLERDTDLYFGSIVNKSGRPAVFNHELASREIGFVEYASSPQIGEYLPVCRREILENKQMRYVDELRGFVALLWLRILKHGGRGWIDPHPVRIYDDIRTDRICYLYTLHKAAPRLRDGFLHYLKEFGVDLLKISQAVFDRVLLRVIVYAKLSSYPPEVRKIIDAALPNTSVFNRVLEATPSVLISAAFRIRHHLRKMTVATFRAHQKIRRTLFSRQR